MKIANRKPHLVHVASGSIAIAVSIGGVLEGIPFLSYGPQPRVEDCAQIQQATPTKYICDGKQYTSVQLTDIRDGKPPTSRQNDGRRAASECERGAQPVA